MVTRLFYTPVWSPEEWHTERHDKPHAQLIDWCYARRLSKLERQELTSIRHLWRALENQKERRSSRGRPVCWSWSGRRPKTS